jgi:hypothetical protein
MVINVSEIESGKGSGKRKWGAAVQGWFVPKKKLEGGKIRKLGGNLKFIY